MGVKSFKNIHFLKILRIFLLSSGIFFLLCIILAFTTLPYYGIHWLGSSKSEMRWVPQAIILLGGGGMPSESNLMRSWYTGMASENFPEATVVIAMPGKTDSPSGTPQRIKKELLLRGIQSDRIIFENEGTNTRSQAIHCKEILKKKEAVLLVTAPEHMRRAVLSFQKAGFEKVNALPAFENATEANLTFRDNELGGNKNLLPEIGRNLSLRYQLWNHLRYEIILFREFMALGYYKLKGWI